MRPREQPLRENPFAPARAAAPDNPFAPPAKRGATDALAALAGDDLLPIAPSENPFAVTRPRERPLREGVPRKLALLDRGRGVFGSYGKTALADGNAVGWCQFGPLSAYPRALRLRDLYPQLPDAPLPAVITCIATTADARRRGYARQLVLAVCQDLAERGFAAVEAYPDLTRAEDEQSGGRPALWEACGFAAVVDDPRFPVYRRELD
jgi:ribosomal protein S18 acetylase RimI-like enzyme